MSDSESETSNYEEEINDKKQKDKDIDPENIDSDEEEENTVDENQEDDVFSKSDQSDENDDDIDDDDTDDDADEDDEDDDGEIQDDLDEDADTHPPVVEKSKKQTKKSTKTNTKKPVEKNDSNYNSDNDDEDEDDDNDAQIDEHYLQKIDSTLKNRIIEEYHPELQQHNYEEIAAMSKIVRDDDGNIIDQFHKTMPFITKYEMTKVVGSRAQQIAAGGKPFIPIEPNMIDSYLIALEEFKQQKIPFIIKRPFPNGNGCEYWKVKDLEVVI